MTNEELIKMFKAWGKEEWQKAKEDSVIDYDWLRGLHNGYATAYQTCAKILERHFKGRNGGTRE